MFQRYGSAPLGAVSDLFLGHWVHWTEENEEVAEYVTRSEAGRWDCAQRQIDATSPLVHESSEDVLFLRHEHSVYSLLQLVITTSRNASCYICGRVNDMWMKLCLLLWCNTRMTWLHDYKTAKKLLPDCFQGPAGQHACLLKSRLKTNLKTRWICQRQDIMG